MHINKLEQEVLHIYKTSLPFLNRHRSCSAVVLDPHPPLRRHALTYVPTNYPSCFAQFSHGKTPILPQAEAQEGSLVT